MLKYSNYSIKSEMKNQVLIASVKFESPQNYKGFVPTILF